MSGYWDAVTRAALGLQGSAQPRPRSLFEPDDAFSGDLPPLEEDVDLSPQAPSVSPTRPAPFAAVAAEQPRNPEPPPSAPPPPAVTHPVRPARTEPAGAEPRGSAPREPVTARESLTPVPISEPRERPEPPRIETTRIVSDTVSKEPIVARVPALAAAFVASPPPTAERPESDEATAETAEPRASEPPALAIAEPAAPVATPAPPLAAHEPEPPPLVVEIGRIEIRIASESAKPQVAPPRRASPAAPSLGEYLSGRSGAAR